MDTHAEILIGIHLLSILELFTLNLKKRKTVKITFWITKILNTAELEQVDDCAFKKMN